MLGLTKSNVSLSQQELVDLTNKANGQTIGEIMEFLAEVEDCDLTAEQKEALNTAAALRDESAGDDTLAPANLKEAVKALLELLQTPMAKSANSAKVSAANTPTVNRLLADLKATLLEVVTLKGGIKQDTAYNAQVVYTTKGIFLINGNNPVELFKEEMKGKEKTLLFKAYKLVERTDETNLTTMVLKSTSNEELTVRAYIVPNDRNVDTGMKSWKDLYNLFNNVPKGGWVELKGSTVEDAIVPLVVTKNTVKVFANPARGIALTEADKLSNLFYRAREKQFTPKVSRLLNDDAVKNNENLLLEVQANQAKLENKILNFDAEMNYKVNQLDAYEQSPFKSRMSFKEFTEMFPNT